MTLSNSRDEETLRSGLALIDEVVRAHSPDADADADAEASQPSVSSRVRLTGLIAAAAVLVATVTAGTALLVRGGDSPQQASVGRNTFSGEENVTGQSQTQWVACTRSIVEGDVLRTEVGNEPGHLLVTISVTKWIKPTTGPAQKTFDIVAPHPLAHHDPLAEARDILLMVNRDTDRPSLVYGLAETPAVARHVERLAVKVTESGIACTSE